MVSDPVGIHNQDDRIQQGDNLNPDLLQELALQELANMQLT